MAFNFNGTTIDANYTVKFNGVSLDKIICDGVTVWEPYLYLYNKGDKCTSVHDGFVALATSGFGRGSEDWCSAPTITYNTSTVKIAGHTSSYGSVFTKNKISLTNYNTLNFVVSATSNSGTCRVGVTTSNSYGYNGTYKDISSKETGIVSIDISDLTGNYYVAIEIDGNRTKTFSQIYLSK